MAPTFIGSMRTLASLFAAFLLSITSAGATETLTFIHTDAAGSSVAATDTSGNVVLWREAYRPYGDRRLNQPDAATNRQFFHGKAFDSDTGLSYFGARYYDPLVGRFMGADPQGFQESNLHSFNRYAYGNNNPFKFIDPDGHEPITVAVVTYMGIGMVTAGAANAALQYLSTGSVQWGGLGGVLDAAGDGAMFGPLGFAAGIRAAATNSVSAATRIAAAEAPIATRTTLRPGPFAGESIPARSPSQSFRVGERKDINRIMGETGCHTCGTKIAGTKYGNAVPDHQPVSALNTGNASQRLYPQCINCSSEQGMETIRALRERKQ